jgi:hypothetical protein
MSVNEEVEAATSDSFWEVDQFRRTVKRVDDGLHMTHELSRLISERAEIEREYAKKLQLWSKKWNEIIEKGPEYGTNKAILLGSLNEAEALAEVHIGIKDKLLEVRDDVKKWRHDTYKKQMVGGCKQAKDFDDEFRKAQKPWSKKLAKVQKCRKDYHSASKLEKTLSAQLSAETNSDQTKKLQDRLEKCRKDVESMKDKYEEALAVLHKYNATYIDDMTEVFTKTQEFEEKRLRYFKEALVGIHNSLNISQSNVLSRIYDQLRQTINMSDANKDLKWWAQNHGVDMAMMWPVFEEFSTEPNATMRKDKTRSVYVTSSDTSLHTGSPSDKNGGIPRMPASQQPVAVGRESAVSQEAAVVSRTAAVVAASQPAVVPSASTNPFDEDDEDADDEDFSNIPGVPVEALFNYTAQEGDELSFKQGDKFEKLKDKDDQGWCTGRKDGRVGLYPDNYVKLLK